MQRRPPQPPPTSDRQSDCRRLELILPDELILHVARQLFALPRHGAWYAVCLRQASSAVRAALTPLWEEVSRLRIRPSLSRETRVFSGGWKLFSGGYRDTWASFGVLPVVGRTCWSIRVLSSMGGRGLFYVGVTHLTGRWAWGLCPHHGHVRRWHRDQDGRVCGAPAPSGYPNGHKNHALFDADGKRVDLASRCRAGTVITIVFDADAGVLSFRADAIGDDALSLPEAIRCPLHEGVTGFPRGERLRPWVRISGEDTVAIRPALE